MVSEELRAQELFTDGRTDRRTDGRTPDDGVSHKLDWSETKKLLHVVLSGTCGLFSWLFYKWVTKPRPVKTLNASYDYIVVGAGSSGAVLASRLSEDSSSTVLMIEAGGSEEGNFAIKVPLMPFMLQKSNVDWGFVTEPQKHACKGYKENKSFWPRGRVLGGSSCLNYMVYVRGSRHDFDDWAANGCEGWSYKDVLPYFIKSENIQIPELRNSDYRGKDGPLHVSKGYVTPLVDIYGEAMEELGYKTVDSNGEDIFGYCKMQLTTQNGTRCSTAKAFLRPAMSRRNLHVTINTVVTKVIIENKKAVGVEVIKNGKRQGIRCNKEVILSAGSVGSPHILMLSGVGPKEHLREHGIQVHADLPVGQNLQDHIFIPMSFFPNKHLSVSKSDAGSLKSLFSWLIWGTGCMSFSGLEATAYVNTKMNSKNKYPDMQLHFFSVTPPKGNFEEASVRTNMAEEIAEVLANTDRVNKERFTIFPTLIHPKSRGFVKLRSSDPLEHPIIDPNYLSEKEDIDTLIRGIRLILKIADTSVFKRYGVDSSHPNLRIPAFEEFKYNTDEFWEDYARKAMMTVYHPTSTCAMGGEKDQNAVVDPSLRVRGIENLRVADCSVMRTITSVGAGSSGSVLANRLSEDPSNSVLVVEAGDSGECSLSMAIPFLRFNLLKSKYDWEFYTEKQKHSCKGLREQRSYWPRGRVLGGTSCLNGMVYVRGSRHDYDDWAANGCEGWSYKDVLPYFIKSENIQVPELRNSDYHGKEGPLHVSPVYNYPLLDIYGEAFEELGYKSVDTNGEDMIGYSKAQLTTENGYRCSTAKAFLLPAISRSNLHVSINTTVTKVIIENKKAVGIEVIKDGKRLVVKCNKEVILSAGSIGSPHILMLSGVGPQEHLTEHGIQVHADLPVGQNLQDHLFTPITFFPNKSLSITVAKAFSPKSILNWLFRGKGFLSNGAIDGSFFVKTNEKAQYKYPDTQLHFFSITTPKFAFKDTLDKMNICDEFAEVLVSDKMPAERFSIFSILLHPKSRGAIRLRTSDPTDSPIIDPDYLSEQEDVDMMVKGIKFSLQVARTSVFKRHGIDDTHPDLHISALKKYNYGTDEYWEEYVRHMSFTVYHPTSTCAMGSENDKDAVVDPFLRVKGIDNLRVADCSVMRTITSGNTNAPAIMIGEKAADIILQRDSVKDIKERIRNILDKL
ncbi:hypothetical protein FSP39_016702 [Pinctada imbricata]|uniref:Glucose-methanol-choline oxidoreductase N-terminal domain-containing protein n=1 Tax=Pinctada imbricata TaxID=66713 RepID=A0AA88Y9Z8_PINIB|nr:hypothetical protein FSP39_016702 [Pinctada imbricata]